MLMAVMPRIIPSLLFPLELVPEQLIAPDMEHPELPVEPEQTCTQEDHLDQAVQCPLEEQLLKMALMDLHHNVPDPQGAGLSSQWSTSCSPRWRTCGWKWLFWRVRSNVLTFLEGTKRCENLRVSSVVLRCRPNTFLF